ncbi:hypothetical protein RMSM_01906 [Rhodopirellula maiorica SM1]|uniref:Uncharacterized protein n=1 Tax=Rhodopirellula maiorica SM1 TaxID=1265738 RepID=M5S4P4_9BACT|nr:hypothetical protein RMSM_01906 [Rhodopirellula maiorica SM1]
MDVSAIAWRLGGFWNPLFFSVFENPVTRAYPATMGQSSPETLWQGDGPSSRCGLAKESESLPEIAFS